MGVDISNHLKTARALPIAQPEDQDVEERGSKYGDAWVYGPTTTSHPYADEGSYFVVTSGTTANPPVFAGFANPLLTAFTDNTPVLYILNNEISANPAVPDVCLEQIRLIVTAIPAGTMTAINFAIILDNVPRTFTTDANTTLLTPAVPNFGVSPRFAFPLIKAQSNSATATLSASSASRRVAARGSWGATTIVGDELAIVFGRCDVGSAAAAVAGRRVTSAPAFEIAPGTSMALHVWTVGGTTSGPSFEIEMSGWVR